MPQPEADDEVAELARTLQGMLQSLDDAHAETEAMLARQRRFVADASHELRTPLTSVLANLELLAESLRGDQGDAARSALRSSRRMRRLVADLLLLARTDVGRDVPRTACATSRRSRSTPPPSSGRSAASTSSRSTRHPAVVLRRPRRALPPRAQPDRERAAPHPAGNCDPRVHGSDAAAPAEQPAHCSSSRTTAPACPPSSPPPSSSASSAAPATAGGSFGLGLAIVRAVAESHGGSVVLEEALPHGARFGVRLPLAPRSDLYDNGKDHRPAVQPVVDQLR